MSRISLAEYQSMLARLERNPIRDAPPPDDAVDEEGDLHSAILDECLRRGWLTIHARMDLPTTIKVGSADFVILADHGNTFLVEAKSRRGKLTSRQQAWLAWARRLGHRSAVVYSFDEFLAVVDGGKVDG